MNHQSIAAAEAADPIASSSQRVLAIGGLVLVAGGMLFGVIFAMFVLHPNNARIGEAMFAASQLIPAGDVDGIMAQFMSIGGFLENRGTKVDTHSHAIHVGYIALLLAMVQPWVALSERTKRCVAWLFIWSAIVLPPAIFSIHYVGLAYSPFSHIGWGSVLADLSGFLLGLVMFIQCWGLWKHVRQRDESAALEPTYIGTGNVASRTLLVGGLLLLVIGYLYGAAMAAWQELGTPASEVAILKDIVSHSASMDEAALGGAFDAFGKFQMYRAINIATHTHINEMGILLLLLSFVQNFVQYSDTARRRWAAGAVVCGFGLPLGVVLEIPYGIVGSIIADFAGFMMIVCLMAMLFGLLRHTGSVDSSRGGVA